MVNMKIVEFISKTSAAGIVNVELGFAPALAVLIQNHGGTNPNIWIWCNSDRFSSWAEALGLLITGSTGVITRDTASLNAFDGGNLISTAETTDSDPKHIDHQGTAAAAGHIAAAGVAIPADHQTAGGRNLLIAFEMTEH